LIEAARRARVLHARFRRFRYASRAARPGVRGIRLRTHLGKLPIPVGELIFLQRRKSLVHLVARELLQDVFDCARIARQEAVLDARLRVFELRDIRRRRAGTEQRHQHERGPQDAAHEADCTTIHTRTIARPAPRFKIRSSLLGLYLSRCRATAAGSRNSVASSDLKNGAENRTLATWTSIAR